MDRLWRTLGIDRPAAGGDHPALAWRRAGLMEVTGTDRPLMCPVPVTALADAALAALKALAGPCDMPANGALLLGERSRMMGLVRQGQVSANGSCRLLATRDGWIALNLPREDDWDLAGALVQRSVAGWHDLDLADWASDDLVERGRMLGLAIAASRQGEPVVPLAIERHDRLARTGTPLVVDLSALWAGPLAGSLMAMAGARVIKVESSRRRDGAGGFFDLLNRGKERVVLDFHDPHELAELRRLVAAADIVIEASRPRALRQLGIDAAAHPGVWLSITAHGRAVDAIGYGDDAAVAGGLSAAMAQAWGQPLFAGDAIADPLTGILAALAGWALWRQGQGALVSIAMADAVACAGPAGPCREWQALAEADRAPFYPLRG